MGSILQRDNMSACCESRTFPEDREASCERGRMLRHTLRALQEIYMSRRND